MLRGIISSSLSFRYLVVVLVVVMMITGIFPVRQMPVDFLPEFSPPYVEIQTEALGLSAEEVEQMITVPMEQDLLAGVAWLDVIRSESVPGLSSVLIYFEPGTDIYYARQMVAERIAQAAVGLPHVSKPPTMIQPLSSASRFMVVGLSSKTLSLIQMSVLARWVIAPRLMGVPGVAHVAIWGNRDRQLQVQVNPEQLQIQGVSLQQVIETAGNALWVSPLSYLEASSPGTGGFIDTPNQRLGIWHVLPISSPEDLAQVAVEGSEGLLLGDVATVVEDHQPLIGDAIVNESPNLLLVVEKLPGMNALEVTQGVETALDALKPGMAGIEFDATIFRPATFIEMAAGNLTNSFIFGAILSVLLLFAFLYDWRMVFISLVALSLSVVTALFVLYSLGATVNAIALAGLVVALGIIIDDAIRDVENVSRRLRLRNADVESRPVRSRILDALEEIRSPVFLATLIAVLAVLPVFFMNGLSGALFQPLAESYMIALLVSFMIAAIVTPALAYLLLPGAAPGYRQSPLVRWLLPGYEQILGWLSQRPRVAYAAVAFLIIIGLATVPFLRQDQILPAFNEPYLIVQLEGAPATSHPEMDRIVSRMSQELRTIPGVRNVGALVGRAVFGDQTVGINSAQILVNIDPRAEYATTVAAVEDTVNGYVGLSRNVRTYMQQVLSAPQNSASDDISVRLFGEDHQILKLEAEKLRQVLATIHGVVGSHVLLPVEEPTLEIEVNLAAAQYYGIKPGDARRAAATLLSGLQVGNLFEEQKVFDVIVWSTEDIRNNLTNVRELLIDTPGGSHVRLGDVAEVRMGSSPTIIRREAVSPYIDIRLNVQGRNIHDTVRDVEAVIHGLVFPLEYHAVVQSDLATQQTTRQNLLIAGFIALLGIFLLIQASCSNWKLASLSFMALAACLAGCVLAAFFTAGGAIALSSLAGFVAVFVFAARSSILLTRHYQRLEKEEGGNFSFELILRGARDQFIPIVLPALTTAFMLLPLVIFGNIPGQEIFYPMAIIIIGGLVAVMLVNLFVMPFLYQFSRGSQEADLEFTPAPAPGNDGVRRLGKPER